MSSDQETTKIPPAQEESREDVIASVRLKADAEKLIRRAAVEVDQSRSDFMAQASEAHARAVLAAVPAMRTA